MPGAGSLPQRRLRLQRPDARRASRRRTWRGILWRRRWPRSGPPAPSADQPRSPAAPSAPHPAPAPLSGCCRQNEQGLRLSAHRQKAELCDARGTRAGLPHTQRAPPAPAPGRQCSVPHAHRYVMPSIVPGNPHSGCSRATAALTAMVRPAAEGRRGAGRRALAGWLLDEQTVRSCAIRGGRSRRGRALSDSKALAWRLVARRGRAIHSAALSSQTSQIAPSEGVAAGLVPTRAAGRRRHRPRGGSTQRELERRRHSFVSKVGNKHARLLSTTPQERATSQLQAARFRRRGVEGQTGCTRGFKTARPVPTCNTLNGRAAAAAPAAAQL